MGGGSMRLPCVFDTGQLLFSPNFTSKFSFLSSVLSLSTVS